MLFGKPKLKQAIGTVRAEMTRRITGAQGGVPTFFDNFLHQVLGELEASAKTHRWDPDLETTDATTMSAVNLLRWFESYVTRRTAGRFVSFAERTRHAGPRSDIPHPVLSMSQGAPMCLSWRGLPLFKTAFDFALLPMLLAEVKPKTIFEIGSGTGASALWMADLLRLHDNDTSVHSADLKPPHMSINGQGASLAFHKGDCHAPETLFPTEVLKAARHPWLVIEDAHVNVEGVLAHMDRFMATGDYLIVEDSPMKARAIVAFLETSAGKYDVDTLYTDFFGRNATCAADSIFRRSGDHTA